MWKRTWWKKPYFIFWPLTSATNADVENCGWPLQKSFVRYDFCIVRTELQSCKTKIWFQFTADEWRCSTHHCYALAMFCTGRHLQQKLKLQNWQMYVRILKIVYSGMCELSTRSSGPLQHHIFKKLCDEIGSDFEIWYISIFRSFRYSLVILGIDTLVLGVFVMRVELELCNPTYSIVIQITSKILSSHLF